MVVLQHKQLCTQSAAPCSEYRVLIQDLKRPDAEADSYECLVKTSATPLPPRAEVMLHLSQEYLDHVIFPILALCWRHFSSYVDEERLSVFLSHYVNLAHWQLSEGASAMVHLC